jgi:hypothetical protein
MQSADAISRHSPAVQGRSGIALRIQYSQGHFSPAQEFARCYGPGGAKGGRCSSMD